MATLFKRPKKDANKGPQKDLRRQFSGDPEDFRLSLVEHLEELRDRIIRSIAIITVTWIIGWFLVMPLYNLLEVRALAAIQSALPKGMKPIIGFRTFTDAFMLKFKLSFYIGLVMSLPFLVLQLWGFVMPALKLKEQQPLKRIAPFSVGLFLMGAGFAWLITPSAMHWFATYVEEFPGTTILQEPGLMIFLVLKMMLAFGIAFQLPLVVYILGALELLSAETLIKYWRQAATAIFVIAMIVTPSQDPMTMLMMAIPLVGLFMASVYIVKIMQSRKRKARLLTTDDIESE